MNESKPVLAIETSQSLCSVCVYFSDEIFYEMNINLKNSHAEKLFEATDFVLKSSGVNAKDLDAIAVSAGPGSFTGLRIGMSAAKGLAFGAKLPIVSVPTFEAMALQIANYLKCDSDFFIANKVNVEELYFAKFQVKGNSYIFTENLGIIKRDEFGKRIKNTLTFGNVFPLDGKIKNLSAPNSSFIAKWCNLFGEKLKVYDYDFLEPNYLKNFVVKERKKND